MLTFVRPWYCVLRDAFVYQFVCLFQVGKLCYQVFLDLGKTNIGDLLAVRTENNIIQQAAVAVPGYRYWTQSWIGDWRSSDKYSSVSWALQTWFISSKVTAYKYLVSGITRYMYSREERTRLTGDINYMSAFIPGA